MIKKFINLERLAPELYESIKQLVREVETLRNEKATLIKRKLAAEQDSEGLKAKIKNLNNEIARLQMDASVCDCKKVVEKSE
jgi:seryl-tRNA synthetase